MTMKGHHERLSRCWGGDSEAGGKQEGSGPSSQPAPLPSPMVATAQSPGGQKGGLSSPPTLCRDWVSNSTCTGKIQATQNQKTR